MPRFEIDKSRKAQRDLIDGLFIYVTKTVGNNHVVNFLFIIENIYVHFIYSSFKSTMGKTTKKRGAISNNTIFNWTDEYVFTQNICHSRTKMIIGSEERKYYGTTYVYRTGLSDLARTLYRGGHDQPPKCTSSSQYSAHNTVKHVRNKHEST